MTPAPRVVGPRKLHVLQGSPEWLAARREHVTATDMAAIEGASPWRCEQDVADEKLNGNGAESTLVMRVGNALEDLIAAAYAEQTGRKVRRVRGLWESATIPWAAASPDATAAGRLVELKWTGSRARFRDGLPEDVEIQARWQALVADVPEVDVAALTVGEDQVRIFTVVRDPAIEHYLVGKAEDFRRRLAAGGPFAQSAATFSRMKDSGVMLPASPDLAAMVRRLADARAAKKVAEAEEDTAASALRAVLGEASGIEALLTARKSAGYVRVGWPQVATSYRSLLEATAWYPTDELDAIVTLYSKTEEGRRALRLLKGDTDD